jgi:hypothetical protein
MAFPKDAASARYQKLPNGAFIWDYYKPWEPERKLGEQLLAKLRVELSKRVMWQQFPLANALCAYANSLPTLSEIGDHDCSGSLVGVIDAVLEVGRANFSSNTIMVPVLKTLDVLFEGEALGRLCSDDVGVKRYAEEYPDEGHSDRHHLGCALPWTKLERAAIN